MQTKKVRLPGPDDIDPYGMCTMQVLQKDGSFKVKKVPAVDAREIILSDAGSLDIQEEVQKVADSQKLNLRYFESYDLDELRSLCADHDISYTGKPASVLRRLLAERGVEPPTQ